MRGRRAMAGNTEPEPEFFSSRWGVLFTALGMAIGTGDIWRFPPQVAANGGGAFLIPWMLFLFTWSIPLLIVEFGMGRAARRGTVGAFARLFGARYAWMGGFVGFCSLAIMFYYTVVAGWCLKYLWAALRGGIWESGAEAHWTRFAQAGSWEPVFFQAAAMAIGCSILHRGVNRGLERANRVFIPVLFLLLAATVVRAVTLPGAGAGLAFLYRPEWGRLADYEVWLAALSQSAWSTGAGWGLILTIGVYLRREETVVGHSLATGLGDNLASLLAASAVLPTVFFRHTEPEALALLGQGNTGLSFVVLPDIFREMQFGRACMVVFFLALCLAAVSSLIAMIELGARILLDAGWTRGRAVWAVGAVGFLCGVPSALSPGFFANQDWVWGLGLTVSGFLFAAAVGLHGARSFRERHLHSPEERWRVGRWFDFLIVFLIPAQF
ncbi:MAG: sodium-dependent transporter, partial [Acidobacteria bacterium]|nr:sodium-dependent transporter [Acidobacteriota bacterium]